MTRDDSLPRGRLTDNALTVLAKRYLKKDEDGNPVESAEDMLWRVAETVAAVEKEDVPFWRERFYEMMIRGEFLPNSPTLMNAGRPLGQLSACFVLPVEDAISNGKDGIYDTLTNMALIHKSGGGTGFSFDRLRPANSMVRSTTGVASGPVSFMRLYDASTDVVKQGGTRRGANMGILRVDHPDILEFIACKSDTSQITNFNISVAVTDEFMRAVKSNSQYEMQDGTWNNAADVFDLIVEQAWKTGEPGVFFIDRANEENPIPHLGDYEATNPCGEQPLLPYDVCNLGSINVGAFVENGEVDWKRLETCISRAVRFLDNVIDANKYPLPQIDDLSKRIRRIGLGIMGFADYLVRLGVRYDSEDGLEAARELARCLELAAHNASETLGVLKGPFPEWEQSVWGPERECAREDGYRIRMKRKMRNCNVTTIAPTGTISMIAGCSGGIEPLFAIAFKRNQAGEQMVDVNQDFVARAKNEGWYSAELMQRIAEAGHIRFDEVPKEVQEVFRTANDISPYYHVQMQAAFQEHVDSAISKTTNFPSSATKEDVRQIYEHAFDQGLKGITVYRDGSRPMQVLSTGKTPSTEVAPAVAPTRRRPQTLNGSTVRQLSPVGNVYLTLNSDSDGNPFEAFVTSGKSGAHTMANAEAISRLISLALRSGVPLRAIYRQLRGISSDQAGGVGPNAVLSLPDAIAQAMSAWLPDKEPVRVEQEVAFPTCENCTDADWVVAEGCATCRICGMSKCS